MSNGLFFITFQVRNTNDKVGDYFKLFKHDEGK